MSTGENSIIEFLTLNPDFLVRHPDLLRHLRVPHGVQGNTVSLVEYQASLLRERLRGLEQQYQSENQKAKAHRHLSKALKPLVGMLYECHDELRMLNILENFLTGHYRANCVRIFASAISGNARETNRYRDRFLDARRRGLFTLILNNPKPLCDSLQHEHLVALFGEEADMIHSSLLIPFRYRTKEALLAVGSHEWNQYRQSVELDILSTVIEILSRLTETTAA